MNAPIATPRAATRALVDEIIWWHNAIGARDDGHYEPVTFDEILSHDRSRRVVRVRHDCIRRVREKRPEMSYPTIGRYFNRDHTTIMHAIAHHTDPRFKRGERCYAR